MELVTGKPPYADLIPMSAMFRIVEDDYPPLPANISANMRDFLLCCFQKDPSKRPSATELKLHPWIQQHDKGCCSEAPSARQSLATATTYQALAQMPVPTENEKNLQYPRIYYNIMPDGNSLQSSSRDSGSSTVKEESTREGNANDRYGNGGQGLHCFTLTCFGSQRRCTKLHTLCGFEDSFIINHLYCQLLNVKFAETSCMVVVFFVQVRSYRKCYSRSNDRFMLSSNCK